MSDLTRRGFLRDTSLLAAGTVAGALASQGKAQAAAEPPADPSKILNHNPRMSYRRLGKTGLMVSEISLGGHWRNREGGGYWGSFANDQVPDDVARNRTEVMSRCIEAGINYLDITTAGECLSYGAALKGRRERMYVGADDHVLCPRNAAMRNVEGQMRNIEACLRRLGTDYLDIWRPQFNQGGGHADRDMAICVETFEKARPQGKVRWLGMSSHNREFISHVIDKFPAYSMVIFPYTAKSKAKPADIKSLDPKEVSESGVGLGLGDTRASIFEAVKKADVGVVTIKPFGGGSLFRTQIKFGATDTSEEDYERARLTLAYILCNGSITATVPGMTTVKEAENNVRASAERHALLDQRGIWKLCEATNEMWDNLPEGYRWLHEWEWV